MRRPRGRRGLVDQPPDVLELDEHGINVAEYDDLQAVRQMRGFLEAPERYLRQVLTDLEGDHG